MIIRIVFHAGESYLDITGFSNIKNFINSTLDNGILYISTSNITSYTKPPVANSVAIPLTSVKSFYGVDTYNQSYF